MVLRVSAGRMVGRDGELGRLLALLDDAEAGQSVAALVSGDAGVGKSRLVSEVTRLAGRPGSRWSPASAPGWATAVRTCRWAVRWAGGTSPAGPGPGGGRTGLGWARPR